MSHERFSYNKTIPNHVRFVVETSRWWMFFFAESPMESIQSHGVHRVYPLVAHLYLFVLPFLHKHQTQR